MDAISRYTATRFVKKHQLSEKMDMQFVNDWPSFRRRFLRKAIFIVRQHAWHAKRDIVLLLLSVCLSVQCPYRV